MELIITLLLLNILLNIAKKGYRPVNEYQDISDFVIYPSEYFYPLSFPNRKMNKTKNTIAIHWFAGSWLTSEQRRAQKTARIKANIKMIFVALLGEDRIEQLKKRF